MTEQEHAEIHILMGLNGVTQWERDFMNSLLYKRLRYPLSAKQETRLKQIWEERAQGVPVPPPKPIPERTAENSAPSPTPTPENENDAKAKILAAKAKVEEATELLRQAAVDMTKLPF